MKTLQECNDCKTFLHLKTDFLPLIKQEVQILEPSELVALQLPCGFGEDEQSLVEQNLEEKTTQDYKSSWLMKYELE